MRRNLEAHPELLEAGPAAAVWAILDKVVDDYQPVVDGIDNDITEVETEIFGEQEDATRRIYFLKREVIEFHHATAPLLGPLESLERGAFPTMDDQLRRYFRDVADHARRADEQVTAQRELLTSILEANLALLGARTQHHRAVDLGLGGDHRRAHVPGLDLGDELHPHAGARRALGLLDRARR